MSRKSRKRKQSERQGQSATQRQLPAKRDWADRFRLQVLAVAYVIYLFLYKDLLARKLGGSVYGNRTDTVLGIVILAALILETFGIYYKTAHLGALMSRAGRDDGNGAGAPLFYSWMFHIVVGVILVMIAGQALFGGEIGDDMNPLIMVLIFLEVIRNLAILLFFASVKDYKKGIPPAKHIFADVCMLFFNVVAYTGTWGVLAVQKGMKVTGSTEGETIVYTFCAILIFLIFFLPMNMMYILEQGIAHRSIPEKAGALATLVVIIIFALMPLY